MSEWSELAQAVWKDDIVKAKELIANGANIEQLVERTDYDCVQRATALGWAVRSWCSPELISALVAAGARVDAPIYVDGQCETPLAHMQGMQKTLAEDDDDGTLRGFQEEFWGRAPTNEWFAAVERILRK
jgi:hypothetical protein